MDENGVKYHWNIVEGSADGYTVSVEKTGITFVLTNTYQPPYTPPDNPPEEPPVDIPDEEPPLGNLPQTGQLWWPVPMLLCGGVLFLITGKLCRRRDEA